jgi:hypothetical protein
VFDPLALAPIAFPLLELVRAEELDILGLPDEKRVLVVHARRGTRVTGVNGVRGVLGRPNRGEVR